MTQPPQPPERADAVPAERVEPAAGWCETCRSWRHTHPCGREECPCAECGQPWGAHGKFAEACGSFKVRPTEPGAPAPAQGEPCQHSWQAYQNGYFCAWCGKPKPREGKAEAAPAPAQWEPPALAGEGAELIATIVYRDGQITYERPGKAEAAPAAEPPLDYTDAFIWLDDLVATYPAGCYDERCGLAALDALRRVLPLRAELAQARAEAERLMKLDELRCQEIERLNQRDMQSQKDFSALRAEAEQLRRERDEAFEMVKAAADDTKDYMDMAQQLEAARAALAEREDTRD